ncbi:MAG: geranylgeranylglyceryl/heptaprenylglyceryl phosphate synthase [Candidatus Zixiibacteriota bacterium]
MRTAVLTHLHNVRRSGTGFLWLVDPQKVDPQHPDPRWQQAEDLGVTAFLVGTSQDGNGDLEPAIGALRERTQLPLILFPGSAAQVSPHVDAVLFLTLLSGRNPEYLVGEQVKGTPKIRDYNIEPIPTGYILVDTGSAAQTSVAIRSRTQPLAESDTTAICDHALCGEYMGHSMIYIEAGSGAKRPIAPDVIRGVKSTLSIPLIVGGGMTTPDHCAAAVQAGADYIVIGTALEHDTSVNCLRDLIAATTINRKVVKA